MVTISVTDKWPYHWSDSWWFFRHPIKAFRSTRLFLLVNGAGVVMMAFGEYLTKAQPLSPESVYNAGAMVEAEGVVYCHEHCCVHDDSTDPYGYGEQDCHRSEHRKLYWKAKAGDYRQDQ